MLIADDSPTVLKIMSSSLFARGFAVKTAASGTEGLQAGRDGMPDINGLDVLQEFKVHQELKDVPVLLLTGQDDMSYARKGVELGASGFLGKHATSPNVLGRELRTSSSRGLPSDAFLPSSFVIPPHLVLSPCFYREVCNIHALS